MVVFACKRKLIKSRLTDGLKMLTFYFALDRPENQLARSRRRKASRIKVTDACQSLIGTFSTFRRCVVFGRMLHFFKKWPFRLSRKYDVIVRNFKNS